MTTSKFAISHPDKIVFPDPGLTKREMVEYYRKIASHMLPWLCGRPLTLKLFPGGTGKQGFIQKHIPEHYPEFIPRLEVPAHSTDETIVMAAVEREEQLAWLANQNVVEFHVPLSSIHDLECPDQMVFDLDPSDDDFEKVRELAFVLKQMLDDRSLPAFVKTTGSRGVHIHVPLLPEHGFDTVKATAKKMAQALVQQYPVLATLEHRKADRGDKVYIDYLRNDYAMTAVAPYSLRARSGAPVATPLDWAELGKQKTGPRSWHLKNIFRRLGAREDPWRDFTRHRVNLVKHDA